MTRAFDGLFMSFDSKGNANYGRMGTDIPVQFKALANELLEEKSKRFTEQNQVNLGQLLGPGMINKIRDHNQIAPISQRLLGYS